MDINGHNSRSLFSGLCNTILWYAKSSEQRRKCGCLLIFLLKINLFKKIYISRPIKQFGLSILSVLVGA